MESLFDNRPLLYSLAGAGGFVVMLALGKAFKLPSVFSSEASQIIPIFQAGSRSSVISSVLWSSRMSLDPFSFRLEIFESLRPFNISRMNLTQPFSAILLNCYWHSLSGVGNGCGSSIFLGQNSIVYRGRGETQH